MVAPIQRIDFDSDTKANDAVEEIKVEAKDLIDDYIEPEDLDEIIAYSYKMGYDEAMKETKKFLEGLGMKVIDEQSQLNCKPKWRFL